MSESADSASGGGKLPRIEEFLTAVEAKTSNEVHRRLLRACRTDNPGDAMEAELGKIIEEIINDH